MNRIILLAALCTVLASCRKFLALEPPKSSIERSIVFDNEVTALSATLGLYSEFRNGGFAYGRGNGFMAVAGLSSDELVNVPRRSLLRLEFQDNRLSPVNTIVETLWKSLYSSIYQCNSIIEGLSASQGVSVAAKAQLMGEAYFIRAFCHFYLVNMFGDAPLVLTTDYERNRLMPRTASDEIYAQVITDLLEAYNLMSPTYEHAENEKTRANKYVAAALLARAYLYHEEWEKAEQYATEVIGQKSLYDLDNLDEVFLKNSKEAIWQINPGEGPGGLGNPPESDQFDPREILEDEVARNGIMDAYETADQRALQWMDTLFVDTDTIYYPHKYNQYPLNAPTKEYSMFIRLAEVYLIRAEARAMLNKLTGANSAASDINAIRNRAGLGNTAAATQAALLDDVMHERRLELFTEWGHRWLDLKRTGRAVAVLSAIKPDFDADDELYPVPQSEFIKNPNLGKQNDGY